MTRIIFWLCCVLIFCVPCKKLQAQASEKIHHIEYFFDTDPGFGSATSLAVPTPAVNLSNFTFTPSTASLSKGLHNLYVRAIDSSYRWSQSTSKLFYKEAIVSQPLANIISAEYYLDTDPGFGNGTQLPLTAAPNVSFNIAPNIGSLSKGLHQLFVRVKNADGNWSLTSTSLFYKETLVSLPIQNVVSAEYYFDTDPGFGNGMSTSVTAGQNINFPINGNIASLNNGLHRLFVRVKDAAGNWSQTTPQLFYKEGIINRPTPNVTTAEYYFDTDPGFGNGQIAALTAGQNVTFAINGNITALTNGLHRLYVRTKDATGNWSQTTPQLFYKEAIINRPTPNVIAAEYYFDTDPGFGSGQIAAVTAGQNVTFSINGNITALSNGLHRLYVRTKDATGNWSQTIPQLFYKEAIVNSPTPNVVAAEYYFDTDPGFGNANTFAILAPGQIISQNFTAAVNSLTKGLHRLYTRVKDAAGRWSITNTQLFYYEAIVPNPPLNNLVKLEWFWNTDPGFGNATPVTLPAGNNGQVSNFLFTVPVSGALQGAKQNFYVRLVDDEWSLTTVRVVDFTNIVLPITLLEFTAKAESKTVLTSWITSREIDTDRFEVEHSNDGISFAKIGTIAASGNSSVDKSYSLVHFNPITGLNYYRLKQFDKDGAFTYSPIVKVLFRSDDKKPIAYPLPVTNILNIRLPQDLATKALSYSLIDGKSTRVLQGKITGTTSQINMSNFSSAVYYFILTDESGNKIWQQMIMKQ